MGYAAFATSAGRQDLPPAGSQGWDGRCGSSHSQDRRRSGGEHEDWHDEGLADVDGDNIVIVINLPKQMNFWSCFKSGG